MGFLEEKFEELFQKLEELKNKIEAEKSSKQPEGYMSVKEAAEYLHVTLPTIHDWAKRGIIPSHRIESRKLFRREELDASVKKVQTLKSV